MELAAALHHSREARSNVVHSAPRGQKTASSGTRPEPFEEVSEPQDGAVTVGYVAAPGPLFCTLLLADAAADAVDARTFRFLLRAELKKEEEERRRTEKVKKEDEAQMSAQWFADLDSFLATPWAREAASRGSQERRRKRKKEEEESMENLFLPLLSLHSSFAT